jgi:hypothetical protein
MLALHTGLPGELPDFQQGCDCPLLRCMKHNCNASENTKQRSQHSKYIQLLIQHDVGQNRTAPKHGQSSGDWVGGDLPLGGGKLEETHLQDTSANARLHSTLL